MEQRAHPVSYALTVTRAIKELASDAVSEGVLPESMAATISKAATEAALSLGLFIVSKGPRITHHSAKAIESARVDLEALAELAGLVRTYKLTPKNAVHLALAMSYTVEQAENRLKQAEDWLS